MKEDGAVERIIVGLDGSSDSMRALQWAIPLARCSGAEVIAVHAWRPTHGSSPFAVEGKGPAQVMLEDNWCAPLAQAKLPHRAIVVEGNPASVLINTAVEERADLIVVGARGIGGFAELLVGSVSQQLTAHAPVPVVVVPARAVPLSPRQREEYRAAGHRLSISEVS